MPVFKELRVKLGYSKLSHGNFHVRALAIYKGTFGNRWFPKPPVDLALYKPTLDRYGELIGAALDGSKTTFAERDSVRDSLMGMVTLLGAYVEHVSNNDPAIFETSGFESLPMSHVSPQPAPQPFILKLKHGSVSGELLAYMSTHYRKVVHFQLRFAELDANRMPGDWTISYHASSRAPVHIGNLKPGTIYAFQVRAMGKTNEYTDWSDSATIMCT